MDLYDWLLALHVLSAFVAVGALVALWALILGTREPSPILDPQSAKTFGRVGGILVGIGLTGALLFGIWLAIDDDAYQLWDGWILASLVLWLASGWAGGKAGKAFESDAADGRSSGIRYQAINSVAVLVILVLMIWKPGA